MKRLLPLLVLVLLASCNTLHVSQSKTTGNTPAIGVEWEYSQINSESLQQKIDSALVAEMERFNAEKHSFTVTKKGRRDKVKDYITIDFNRAKVVGTGGKIAGYTVTAIGLATPVVLVLIESPVIFAFYYWPNHTIQSKITLSPNLSDERKNNKNLVAMTGALFASTDGQVKKLVRKYGEGFRKTLLDVEMQLSQHR